MLLDNFEHVAAGLDTVGALLPACPLLRLIVTSRSMLHVSGEHTFVVPALPAPEQSSVFLMDFTRYAAVTLFVERTRQSGPNSS